ncbi:penicillin-binding transpeptidase domain-containing protein [Candidatus Dependentiae bacterium]|nr:penicillin-binding transpeptidase domain-containing protein [Candidatus Dependentiae bacterium]
MEIPSKHISSRLKIFIVAILLLFFAISFRLFHLQVYRTVHMFSLAQKNFLRYEKISSPRGNIVDCNQRLLATNRPINCVSWQGSGKKNITPDNLNRIEKLSQILNLNDAEKEALLLAEKYGKRYLIKNDVNLQELAKIVEIFNDCENIIITKNFRRYYPYGCLASHILGYLGCMDFELEGKMGLEKMCEEQLKGEPGQLVKTINSVGKNLEEKEVKQPLAGFDIETTINLDFQIIAESVFSEDHDGALILMDPQTGAIEALISRPTFDPSIFLQSIEQNQWSELQAKKALLNRAFNASYPPASIFKLIAISSVLEQKLFNLEKTWYCSGKVHFCGRPYHCSNRLGHGILTFKEAVAQSCNIPFFEMAKNVNIDTLAHYAHKFGLGEKTGTIFPENTGLIPTKSWKRLAKGEPWWPGETLSGIIGQSYLLVTPIQIACMISSIGQGYRVTPRILKNEPITLAPLEISQSTRNYLKKFMREVVKIGTAKKLNKFKDIKIYAKTGTAQTSDLSKRGWGQQFLEHAWFVSYFKYKNHKPLTLIMIIENVGGSVVATSVAKKFIAQYMQLMDRE